jgi:hypothetical protein
LNFFSEVKSVLFELLVGFFFAGAEKRFYCWVSGVYFFLVEGVSECSIVRVKNKFWRIWRVFWIIFLVFLETGSRKSVP